MTSKSYKKRLRVQKGPRSSLGCITCKFRRVKCDEGKPQCQRCLKANFSCQYQATKLPQCANKIIIYSVPRSLPNHPNLDLSAKKSLHYFRFQAVFKMMEPFCSALWTDYIFQLAHAYDFVMSAVVALSFMHESFSQDHDLQKRWRADAMHHYNKAMRTISEATQSQLPESAVLICSIVFYSLECLRGFFGRALQHVQSGMNIIGQRSHYSTQGTHHQSLMMKTLERTFLALQNGVMEIDTPGKSRAFDANRGFDLPIPTQFRCVNDALYYVEVIYNEAHCLLDYYESIAYTGRLSPELLPDKVGPRYDKACHKLKQWSDAFHNLEKSLAESCDTGEPQALRVLRIYSLTLKVVLSNVFSGECFTRYDPYIAKILEEIEVFLWNQKETHSFSLSTGVIAPLFLLSWRCTYIPARDKSLELLSTCKRREGVWDSYMVAQLARRIIAFKSQMATKGCERPVRTIDFEFLSENACQVSVVFSGSSAPLNIRSGSEDGQEESKHVGIVYLEHCQLFLSGCRAHISNVDAYSQSNSY